MFLLLPGGMHECSPAEPIYCLILQEQSCKDHSDHVYLSLVEGHLNKRTHCSADMQERKINKYTLHEEGEAGLPATIAQK